MTTHDQSPAERLAAIKAQRPGSPVGRRSTRRHRNRFGRHWHRMLYGPRGKGRETKPHTDNQHSTGT